MTSNANDFLEKIPPVQHIDGFTLCMVIFAVVVMLVAFWLDERKDDDK